MARFVQQLMRQLANIQVQALLLILLGLSSNVAAVPSSCEVLESKHVIIPKLSTIIESQSASSQSVHSWPCDAILAGCLETDPGSQELLRLIRECWGSDYANWIPSVECLDECLGEKCGSYSPMPDGLNQPWIRPGRIMLCYKGCEEDLYNCTTVRHELQHMLDYCRSGGKESCSYTDPSAWLACLKKEYYTNEGCYKREQRAYCVGDYQRSLACCPPGYNGTPPPSDARPRDANVCCKSVCGSCADGDSAAAYESCHRSCYNYHRESRPLPSGHTPPPGGCVGECVWTGSDGHENRITIELPDALACSQFCQLCRAQHGSTAECALWGDDGEEIRSSSWNSSGSSSSASPGNGTGN